MSLFDTLEIIMKNKLIDKLIIIIWNHLQNNFRCSMIITPNNKNNNNAN